MLANIHHNNHQISAQIMRRFLMSHQMYNMSWPDFDDNNCEAFRDLFIDDGMRGTLLTVGSDIEQHATLAFSNEPNTHDFSLPPRSNDYLVYPERSMLKILSRTSDIYRNLSRMYNTLYPNHQIELHRRIERLTQVKYHGETFRADKATAVNCNVIRAKWLAQGTLQVKPSENFQSMGKIKDIFISKIKMEDDVISHVIVLVDWFSHHNEPYSEGQHLQVYHKTVVPEGHYSYMPIQRIICKCALVKKTLQNIEVLVSIPLVGQWALC